MDKHTRGQRGIVGLHEEENVSVFQDDNVNIWGNMDSVIDDREAAVLAAQSYEFEHVHVPPSESEDCDLNDTILRYISEILMEEDVDKESWMMHQESAALQAAEKSFHQLLQETSSPSLTHQQVPDIDQNVETQDINYADDFSIPNITDTFTHRNDFPHVYEAVEDALAGITSESASLSSCSPSSSGSSSSCTTTAIISPDRMLPVSTMFSNSEMMMHFTKGVEEARKFLPVDGLITSVRPLELREWVQVESLEGSQVNADNRDREIFHDVSRTRKNPHPEYVDAQDERRNKQSAVFTESTIGSEELNMVALRDFEHTGSFAYETIQSEETRNYPKDLNSKGSVGGGSHGKKKNGGKTTSVNVKELLILCAKAVAADDINTANKFLRQIREHSSPTGDGMQRLAHYFAKGLETRMSGKGNNTRAISGLPSSAGDVLRAYQVYLSCCPFRRVSHFFANKVIMNVSEKATRLHIIHFGILYGFQWPSFMQRLSSRPGGPPKLRITGIDVPLPGFKPAERVEQTGRLLANYAAIYGIPFEFNPIAQNWETIKIEDLKLEEGEVLAVNCLYRMKILYDETVMPRSPRENNPRNNVLSFIRKANPDVFILGVVNGAYNSPFFITRFREALFQFSSLFDMLDTTIPRDIHQRMLIEKLMLGRQAINVIACETGDRVERPETYKQWQVRNIRAGLRPLMLDEEIKKMAIQHVKMSYHKDFSIIEDGHWLVQGWRGRNLFALSSWEPAH